MLEHGMHPSEDKRVWSNLVRALAPRTMARGFQALDGKLTSLKTGNAIIDDVNLVEAMAYAFGITPLEIQKNYDALEQAYSAREDRQRGLEAYGEAAAQDLERGDYKEFNQTLRNARIDGYNPFDVSKSAKLRLQKSQEALVNRDYKRDLETQKRLKRYGIDD
jgi:DNA-binding transcriptional regulator YhcF (GntR family)